MRSLAWAVHGAPFAAALIGVEIVTTVMLLVSAQLMRRDGASAG